VRQQEIDFLGKNKRTIKVFGDQQLIAEYNRVLIGLSNTVEELERALQEEKRNNGRDGE